MRSVLIILTLLLSLFFLQGVVYSQISSQAQGQNSEQNKQKLTLDQIKEKIRVYADSKNRKDKAAIDKAIAMEIGQEGVKDFQPCDSFLNDLRKLGAGPQTIQALKTLRSNVAGRTDEQDNLSQKIVILVADFSSEDNKDYNVTQLLFDQLSISTRKYQDVEVKPLGEAIPKRLSRKEVIAKGKEHNATILIWGWLGTSGDAVIIHAHFEVIGEIYNVGRFDSNMLGGTLEIIAGLSELLKGFTIQTRLRSELTTITLFATALSRLRAEDYKVAISQLSDALRQEAVPEQMINVSDIYAARGLAYLYDEGHGSINALNDFNEAIRLNDKNSRAYMELISIYLNQDRFDDVIIHGKKLLEYESNIEIKVLIYYLLWLSYYTKNELEQANHFVEKIMQISEGISNSLIPGMLGHIYTFKEDYKSAHQYFDRAIQLGGKFKDTNYIGRGYMYLMQGENDKAIKDFGEALCLDPKLVWVYHYLGTAYFKKMNYKQAIESYGKYLESNEKPMREDAFFKRGIAFYRVGNNDKSLEDLSSVISLNSSLVPALYLRALIYIEKGLLDESITDFSEVIKINPKDALAFTSRGNVYYIKSLLDKALEDYNEAIRLDKNFSMAYLMRGIIYAAKGAQDQAISDFRTVLQKTNDPELRQKAQEQLSLLGVK